MDRVGLWCLTALSTIFQLLLWPSVLLVEETRVPGENHQPDASHLYNLSLNVLSTPRHEQDSNSQL